MIDASARLRARERAKQAGYERALAAVLAARGADEGDARLLSHAAVGCLYEGVMRWFGNDDPGVPGLEKRLRGT